MGKSASCSSAQVSDTQRCNSPHPPAFEFLPLTSSRIRNYYNLRCHPTQTLRFAPLAAESPNAYLLDHPLLSLARKNAPRTQGKRLTGFVRAYSSTFLFKRYVTKQKSERETKDDMIMIAAISHSPNSFRGW